MTCIAAIRNKKGKIMMAGDRRASWDFSQAQSIPRAKITKYSNMLFGATGDGALCSIFVNLLPRLLKPLKEDVKSADEIDLYMHSHFYDTAYQLLMQKGFGDQHNLLVVPSDVSCECLIAINNLLYHVTIQNPDPHKELNSGMISIDELALPFATGCGGQWAWGAADALKSDDIYIQDKKRHDKEGKYIIRKMTDKELLLKMMNVAAKNSPGCDAVIDIISED